MLPLGRLEELRTIVLLLPKAPHKSTGVRESG